MMYFSQKHYNPRKEEESKQHGAVLKFKENFPKEGLYWEYRGLNRFKDSVYDHLTNYIRETRTS